MEYMNVKAKNNANLKDKPRVYFTCHPADMEKAFERICNDLFAAADCAVYYTEDMAAPIPEENRETDLGRMNLFVIPVTFRLLTQPSRAMDEDFTFAMEQHIPVLPIMLESGLESIYSRPDKFGTLQFLQPGVVDQTAISYEEKLKRYLDSVLIDDKTAERIRAAFDAYIFLSYRKKDRKYANELMRLIHANPVCRDIAIWYDEFLVPGESFSDSIEQAMEKSQLFALLVTPNLVNEDNYVRTTEYPMARAAGKDILPAEAVKTDRRVLERQYEGIPETVDVSDEAAFRQRLLAAVERIARQENDKDPAHNYLIGLAYLEGIDVEVDRQRGAELITSAAEAGLIEAMEKLVSMYRTAEAVERDWNTAISWQKKLFSVLSAQEKAQSSPELVEKIVYLLWDLGSACEDIGRMSEAREAFLESIRFADKKAEDLERLTNLHVSYLCLFELAKIEGQEDEAVEWGEKAAAVCEDVLNGSWPLDAAKRVRLIDQVGYTKKFVTMPEKKAWLEEGAQIALSALEESDSDTARELRQLAFGMYCEINKIDVRACDRTEAIRSARKAVELGEAILAETANGEEGRWIWLLLKKLYDLTGNRDWLLKAMKTAEKLYEEFPEVEAARDLSLTYEHMGLSALEAGENDEAEEWLLKSLALREKNVKNRGGVQAEDDLAHILYHLGRVPTIPREERLAYLDRAIQSARKTAGGDIRLQDRITESAIKKEQAFQHFKQAQPSPRRTKAARQAKLRLFRDFFLTPLPVLAALLLLAWGAKAVFFPSGWAPDLPTMEKLPLIGAVPALVELYGDGDLRTGFLPTLFRVVGVLAAGALPFTIAAVIAGYLTMLTRKLTRKRWACVLSVLLGFGLSMLLLRLIPGLGTGVLAVAFVVLLGIGFAVFPEKETYIVWMALLFVAICAVALWLDQTLLWFTLPGVGIKTFVDLVVLPWAIMTVAFILFLVADLVTYHRE